MICLSVDFME